MMGQQTLRQIQLIQILQKPYNGLVGSETLTLSGQGSVSRKNVSGSSYSVTLGT